jgi:hypothetical protein
VRVLSLIHQADAPMGTFADAVRDRGDELLEWTASNGPPPQDPEGFEALLAADVPTFGVCLGGQLLAKAAGAGVGPSPQPEIGWCEVQLSAEAKADPIFGRLPERFQALQWHSYAFDLPSGAVALATSPVCLQAYRLGERAWGVQFHPEVDATTLNGWLRLPEARRKGFEDGPIESWIRLGRGLADRFLALAAQLPPRSRRAATRAS